MEGLVLDFEEVGEGKDFGDLGERKAVGDGEREGKGIILLRAVRPETAT